jgi:hypothetical protein
MNIVPRCKLDFYHCPSCRSQLNGLIQFLSACRTVQEALLKGKYTAAPAVTNVKVLVLLSCGGQCGILEDRGLASIISWRC